MAGDLPAGNYTAALIGAWWPQPSSTLRASAQAVGACSSSSRNSTPKDLHNQWTQLASRNKGHTVDDLVSRFQQGEKYHLDLAEKYKTKADAFEKGAMQSTTCAKG